MIIRPAVVGDEAAILRIRNDPEALFWSGVRQPILPSEHHLWFQTLLGDPTHCVWVAEDQHIGFQRTDNEVIGYGRMKIRSVGTVSFGVERSSRGRGVGTALLRTVDAEARLLKVDQQAWVHPSNIPSVRAFMRLGYRIGGEPGYICLEKRNADGS